MADHKDLLATHRFKTLLTDMNRDFQQQLLEAMIASVEPPVAHLSEAHGKQILREQIAKPLVPHLTAVGQMKTKLANLPGTFFHRENEPQPLHDKPLKRPR